MDSPPPNFGDLEESKSSDKSSEDGTPRLGNSSLPPSHGYSSHIPKHSSTDAISPMLRTPHTRKRFNAMLPSIFSPASYYRAEEAQLRSQLHDAKTAVKNLTEIEAMVLRSIESLDAQIESME